MHVTARHCECSTKPELESVNFSISAIEIVEFVNPPQKLSQTVPKALFIL